MRRPVRLLLLLWAPLVLAIGGCRAPAASLAKARALIDAGKLAQGCAMARVLLEQQGNLERRLEALRSFIDCSARAGQLEQAARWVAVRPPQQAEALYGRALVELARSPAAFDRAVALLRQAARRYPKQPELAYRLGLLLLADEQPQDATIWLQRACPHLQRAACSIALAHALLDRGRIDDALSAAREAIGQQPRPPDIRRGRALVQRIARRQRRVPGPARAGYREALDALVKHDRPAETITRLADLLPEHPEAAALHTLLGLASVRVGQTADAIVAFRRAAELDPQDPDNHTYLAVIFESRGRLAHSAALYRRALRHDPFSVRAAEGLGRVLHRSGRAREAAAALDHLVALQAGDQRSLRLSGRAHLAAGSLETAEQRFARLLARRPRDFEAHLRMAQILLQRYSAAPASEAALLQRARQHAGVAAAARPADAELRKLQEQLETSASRP